MMMCMLDSTISTSLPGYSPAFCNALLCIQIVWVDYHCLQGKGLEPTASADDGAAAPCDMKFTLSCSKPIAVFPSGRLVCDQGLVI